MVDPERMSRSSTGFLRVAGEGGLSTRQMRELLSAMEEAYAVVDRTDLIARRELVALRAFRQWTRRWGPPEFFSPFVADPFTGILATGAGGVASRPLIVSRVVLTSPGFWEFVGSLNPLEVLRQYLNDRHERRKDDEYRSASEADRLAIGNASRRLDVVRQYLDLRREYGDDLGITDPLSDEIVASIRPALERLGEIDDRKLIEGPTAQTSREGFEHRDRPEA
jgi:hypothetical protein